VQLQRKVLQKVGYVYYSGTEKLPARTGTVVVLLVINYGNCGNYGNYGTIGNYGFLLDL
jgi:hypothetical protein